MGHQFFNLGNTSMNPDTDFSQLTLAQKLAQAIVDFDTSRITRQAIEVSKVAILDTIGVTLAAVNEPSVRNVAAAIQVSGSRGPSSVLGTDIKTSMLDAALINGVGSHALDYDDFSQPMGGHQSVPLVSALLAVAQAEQRSGLDLLRAYVVGIEAEIRVARAVNFHHYDKGWHPTSTVGIFGTVACTGYLMGLNKEQMTTALSIATSLASGIKANFGTMVKPLHVGVCSRNGLFAVLLAKAGYDANPAAFEHKQGYLNVFNGVGNFDAGKIFENWASPLEVLSDQLGLKQFPCCGSTHPAVTMMLKLRREETFDLDDVQGIEILVHKRRLPHTDNPDPTTSLGAKFSVQYAVCRALVSQALKIADFENEAFMEPQVRKMMSMTQARPHPEMPDDAVHQFGAEVRVTLRNGTVLSRRIENLVGRGVTYPMTREELWEKYADCAQAALPADQIKSSFEALERLEEISNIESLVAMLTTRT